MGGYDFLVDEILFGNVDEDKGYSNIIETDDEIYINNIYEFDCWHFLDLFPGKRYVKFVVDAWDPYCAYYAKYDLSDPHDRELFLQEKWLSTDPVIVYIGDDYIRFSLF